MPQLNKLPVMTAVYTITVSGGGGQGDRGAVTLGPEFDSRPRFIDGVAKTMDRGLKIMIEPV